jgi:hypothetical protein
MDELANTRRQGAIYWLIAAILVALNGALLVMLIFP